MIAPDGFVTVASWLGYLPPRRSFYPSGYACERAAVASMAPHAPVRVSTVIAIDEETRATLTRGCVKICRLPYYGGSGWGRW